MAEARKFKSKHARYSPEWLRALREHLGTPSRPVSIRRISRTARVSHVGWVHWENGTNNPDSCHQLILDLMADGTLPLAD